jgi:transposase
LSADRDRLSWSGYAALRGWLASQKLEYAEQRIAFEEMLLAMRQAQERIERLEQAIRGAVPDWSLAEVVTALMAMRGAVSTCIGEPCSGFLAKRAPK